MTSNTRQININGTTHEYSIRRSKRAKHILLHISPHKGIELVVPFHATFAESERFLWSRKQWLAARAEKIAKVKSAMPQRKWQTGERLPYLGQEVVLDVAIDERRSNSLAQLIGDKLKVFASHEHKVRPAVSRWYSRSARHFFTGAAENFSALINQRIERLAIGNHTSQWGSCTARGRLSFNWRLLLGPKDVALYVTAHEVAHLMHPNHSKAYWHLVGSLYPDYIKQRKWLREHGQTLVL